MSKTTTSTPSTTASVDLVILFNAYKHTQSKQEAAENALDAEKQYSNLLGKLNTNGFNATGRKGDSLGKLLVLVSAQDSLIQTLITRERHSDFLHGLPTTQLPSANDVQLSPADRIRILHTFITALPSDGGLGVIPGSDEWSRVESVMVLHDQEFNKLWLQSWTARSTVSVLPLGIKDHVSLFRWELRYDDILLVR